MNFFPQQRFYCFVEISVLDFARKAGMAIRLALLGRIGARIHSLDFQQYSLKSTIVNFTSIILC